MGKKMLVSLALEGKLVADGIQTLEDDDDILTSMARDLVTQRGVGERADAIWKELQAQRPTTFTEPVPVVEQAAAVESDLAVFDPAPMEPTPISTLMAEAAAIAGPQTLAQFGVALRRTTRRTAFRNEDQLSLGF